jgi:hypothetical protein
LEADVALLHIAGGGVRITPPPGTAAQTAPRRAARGRKEDMLFVTLRFSDGSNPPSGFIDHLTRLALDAYFGTPGSVTSALREAVETINDHLTDLNQDEEVSEPIRCHFLAAALHHGDLYIAQAGTGQAVLVRPGRVLRLTSEEASRRPLGASISPYVRYHHLEVQPSDLFILTTAAPPIWSDTTLSGLSSLDPVQAIDRLVAASNDDLTGVLARLVLRGERKVAHQEPAASTRNELQVEYAQPGPGLHTAARQRAARPARSQFAKTLDDVREQISDGLFSLRHRFANLLSGMMPGLVEPPPPGELSTRFLIGTAVGVPLVVVAIAAVAYFGRGRSQQFEEYLYQAEAAVQIAEMKPSAEAARGDWDAARHFLELAKDYDWNKEADTLWQKTVEALDALDLIGRLEFKPMVNGGFGSETNITALAASESDIYVLDSQHEIMWHAWGTPERGYKIDPAFDCLNSSTQYADLDPIVDIVVQPEPGALGAEGVVAIDMDGTLLYCAPERQPAIAQLSPPDIGWGRIRAIDVLEDTLYVLDPLKNSVWIYNATGGLFSGTPELFFVEDVRDLGGSIDMAMAGDELFILYADGRIDRCRRFEETNRIRVECEQNPQFQDDRPGHEAAPQIPGAIAAKIDYSPPPEPSLYFLDIFSNSVLHFSMRLVYQGKYLPTEPFEGEISAFSLGPPNDIYIAIGSQVYHASPNR